MTGTGEENGGRDIRRRDEERVTEGGRRARCWKGGKWRGRGEVEAEAEGNETVRVREITRKGWWRQ